MMVWPAIIAGGASILSSVLPSLLGGKQKSPGQVPYEHIRNSAVRNALALVEAGKQSGIHPLALLGSISGGGYAQPVGGSQFGLGDAIGAGMGALSDVLYKQDADQREEEFQQKVLAAEQRRAAIDNLRSKELTPERKLALKNAELQNQLLELDIAQSRTKMAAAKSAMQGSTSSNTLVGPGGIVFNPVPGRSSAQEAEDQYGEAGDLIFGGTGMIEDFVKGRIKIDPMTGGGPRIPNPLTYWWDHGGREQLKRLFRSQRDQRTIMRRPDAKLFR